MWKHLRWHLFGTATVVLVMCDGERRLGWAKRFGQNWLGSPWDYVNTHYRLNQDGTATGNGLVISWEPCIGAVPFSAAA